MNRIKDMINAIDQISGKYSAYEVFTDWIRCMAMSISNIVSPLHDNNLEQAHEKYVI